MFPLTTKSAAYANFFADLEAPKENCFAHVLLHVYAENTRDEKHECFSNTCGDQNIAHYLNKADLALAQISWSCTDWLFQELAFIPERIDYVQKPCIELAECLKRYALFSSKSELHHLI